MGPVSGTVTAYLLGSFPTGRLVLRLFPSARWGPWVAALADAAKGALVVGLLLRSGSLMQAALVTAVVAGDQWPIVGASYGRPGHWAFLGAIGIITPVAPPIWVVLWAIGFVASGYLAVGRMAAAVLLPLALGFVAGWPLGLIAIPACVMLLDRGRADLRRIRAGEEPKHYWRGEA